MTVEDATKEMPTPANVLARAEGGSSTASKRKTAAKEDVEMDTGETPSASTRSKRAKAGIQTRSVSGKDARAKAGKEATNGASKKPPPRKRKTSSKKKAMASFSDEEDAEGEEVELSEGQDAANEETMEDDRSSTGKSSPCTFLVS
jgi:hypothetical protein